MNGSEFFERNRDPERPPFSGGLLLTHDLNVRHRRQFMTISEIGDVLEDDGEDSAAIILDRGAETVKGR